MKYRRVVVSAFGEPEVLKVVEEELRQPSPGEVLVRVHAAGVARADCNRRSSDWFGQVPPFSLGYDFAGKVDAIGDGSTTFAVGKTVAGINENLNCYSEYIYVSPEWMVAIPDSADPAQAACLGLNYLVALQCLHRVANVRAGQRMLVLGASGGVGTAFIELGKLAGLEVYGTAATTKIDLIRELGAIPIDYQRESLEQRIKDIPFDVVFDGLFDKYFEPAYHRLRANGKYVVFGFAVLPSEYERLFETIRARSLTRTHSRDITQYNILEPYTQDLSRLATYLATGKIDPLVHDRIPLLEASRAHKLLESGAVTGKIVLICE